MKRTYLVLFAALFLLQMLFAGCGTQGEPSGSDGSREYTSYNVNSSGVASDKSDSSTDNGNDSTDSSGDNSTPSGGQADSDSDISTVYMTTDISPEGLMAVLCAPPLTKSCDSDIIAPRRFVSMAKTCICSQNKGRSNGVTMRTLQNRKTEK